MTLKCLNTGVLWEPWIAEVASGSHKEVCRVGEDCPMVRHLDHPLRISLGPLGVDYTVVQLDESLEVVLVSNGLPVRLDLRSSGVIGRPSGLWRESCLIHI